MFTAIADLARSVAGMGINSSGVRQIAAAVGAATPSGRVTAAVLRRDSVLLGLLGAVMLLILAVPVAELTFGRPIRACRGAAGPRRVLLSRGRAEGALIQGTRRIADLAKMGVVGPLLGTGASIAIVYPCVTRASRWRLSSPPRSDWRSHGGLRGGSRSRGRNRTRRGGQRGRGPPQARLRVHGERHPDDGGRLRRADHRARQEGLEAAGLYQAAWTLGGLYVGIVLQAMGTDFYPRLVGSIDDTGASNRLVNEQAQMSLLLAGPGVIATLALAPVALWLLYSPEFVAAAEVLRWTCLGMALRVITWPVGYVIVARNDRVLFVVTELFWAALNVGLTLVLVPTFGLKGAGIAFFLSYVAHGIVVYLIVRRLTGFRWSSANLRTGALYLASTQWPSRCSCSCR